MAYRIAFLTLLILKELHEQEGRRKALLGVTSAFLLLPSSIPLLQNRGMEKLPTILISPAILAVRGQGQGRLQQTLSHTLRPLGLHHKPPKGHSETQFERDLWRYFPGKIHTGLMVQCPGYDQPYLPDFAYIDPDICLHIDIEVDEPYSHGTRQNSFISTNFTFYCPICGEGPIRWQGHYIQCPTCSYDAFAL
jgi:hypothetical protein